MSNRKLQTEIERTLKKVTEGLEIFHETLDKLDGASTAAQKEKVEVELKKEIKKLQRLRDLIKGWQALSELKDKQAINEARRSIELEMERFKILEKEMKIKAYSKEGLSQSTKMDPLEEEKHRVTIWVNAAVDALGTQTDAIEAEMESLLISARKSKGRSDEERIASLGAMIERHKMHVRRLEQIIRFMANDRIGPEDVNIIRDDVEYYVESNQEADFVPDECLYDDFEALFDADENEDEAAAGRGGLSSNTDSAQASGADETDDEGSEDLSASAGPAALARSSGKSSPHQATPAGSANGAIGLSSPKGFAAPLKADAAAPLAAGAGQRGLPGAAATQPDRGDAVEGGPQPSPSMPLPAVHIKTSPPALPISFASIAQPPASATTQGGGGGRVGGAGPVGAGGSAAAQPSFASAIAGGHLAAGSGAASAGATGRVAILPLASSAAGGPYEELQALLIAQRKRSGAGKGSAIARRLDGSCEGGGDALAAVVTALGASFANCPDGAELDKSRTFTPRQPFTTPPYYPHAPPAVLAENPSIFERFELDTLFFIFYYQQRTYAQYLSARELKRQSWRFHKKYFTWFQRHDEPKRISDEFEQGTYIYFDYEGNWCQRKKSEFTFEYRYLEDEETV